MFEKSIVINDLHIPFENPRAISVALKITDDLQPDNIFLDGDILDCWEISEFVKNPKLRKTNSLAYEIERTKSWLASLRGRYPKAKIYYIFGNHEYRWVKYISKNATELAGLKGLSLEEQLTLPELDIKAINSDQKENTYQYGKLLIGHFNKVNKYSGFTAKNLIDDKSISLIQAHTHRGGCSFRRHYDRDIVGYENFCLCDRNPEYTNRPNWQLGFCVIYKDKHSDWFSVKQIYIQEKEEGKKKVYRAVFNDKNYQA